MKCRLTFQGGHGMHECDDPCVDIVAWMPLPGIYGKEEER